MALGVNRDYKTNARRVTNNLKRHAEVTADLINKGSSKGDQMIETISLLIGFACLLCLPAAIALTIYIVRPR